MSYRPDPEDWRMDGAHAAVDPEDEDTGEYEPVTPDMGWVTYIDPYPAEPAAVDEKIVKSGVPSGLWLPALMFFVIAITSTVWMAYQLMGNRS